MDIPQPVPGLVIRYAYLWVDEHAAGQEEGRKDRPVAVVLAVTSAPGITRVVVAPITHTPPSGQDAVEIPPDTKRRLGLDDDRSWVVLEEVNIFSWPGPDIRPVPGKDPATVAYGLLPASLTRTIRDRITALQAARALKPVPRTD